MRIEHYQASRMINYQQPLFTQTSITEQLWTNALLIVAGTCMSLAFAPFHYAYLAIFCPVVLLYSISNAKPSTAFWRGALFGFAFFASTVYWIFTTLNGFANTTWLITILLSLCFFASMALFPASVAGLCARFFPRDSVLRSLLAFPALWSLSEWLRSWLATGFPWAYLGYTQTDTALAGLLPIIGVFGVSFVLLFASGCIWRFLKSGEMIAFAWLGPILLVWLFGNYFWQSAWTQPAGPKQAIAIVQGNVAQHLKWQPEHLRDALTRYSKLTLANLDNNIIVWPEAAIAITLQSAQPFTKALAKAAKEKRATIITGVPIQTDDGMNYYNGVIALGHGKGRYYKRHVVPFGEYMPLRSILAWLDRYLAIPRADIIAGPSKQAGLHSHGIHIAPLVCFETAFADTVRQNLPAAQLLMTLTNDAWFGHSSASAQHLQIARVRSLQTGRYQVVAANTGISAIIDPLGHVTSQAPEFTATILKGEITPMQGSTPWIWYGNQPLLALLLLALASAWYGSRRLSRGQTFSHGYVTD